MMGWTKREERKSLRWMTFGRSVSGAFVSELLFWGVLVSGMFLSGCTPSNQRAEQKKSIRIGVSLYRAEDTFINNLRSELEESAKSYEQENGIKVTLDIQSAKGNQNTQNNQVERFLSLGCDVLVINPVDRTSASSIIDKAMTAGVPTIFFNRQPVEEDMNRWDQLYYVGADAKESAVREGSIVTGQYKKVTARID